MSTPIQPTSLSEKRRPKARAYPMGSPERKFMEAIMVAQQNLERAQIERGRS